MVILDIVFCWHRNIQGWLLESRDYAGSQVIKTIYELLNTKIELIKAWKKLFTDKLLCQILSYSLRMLEYTELHYLAQNIFGTAKRVTLPYVKDSYEDAIIKIVHQDWLMSQCKWKTCLEIDSYIQRHFITTTVILSQRAEKSFRYMMFCLLTIC